MPKILCTNPDHKDSNPSMEVYEDGGWCFVCNHYDPNLSGNHVKKEPEYIGAAIKYIKGLQYSDVRGLSLLTDERGYYILWPDDKYYKRRNWHDDPRYKCPKGVRQPLLKLLNSPNKSNKLIIVEGEMNAISLKTSIPGISICSPGAASNFKAFLLEYLSIASIFAIVVDRDPAGVSAGVWLKRELVKRGKRTSLIACEQDINEILQLQGPEGVRTWAKEAGLEV